MAGAVIGAFRHAVVIEPEGEIREAVLAWKARIAGEWPSAVYLHHPPHCTLWVGDLRSDAGVEPVLEAVSRIPEFRLTVRSPHVFFDDALAGGGQTCAFAVTLTDDLIRLQHVVSEAVRQDRRPVSDDELPAPLRREPFLRSWCDYGFPFVGSHWIPHFTAAALPVPRDHRLVAEFLASTASWQMTVSRVSWWRVVGDRHERVATRRLALPGS
jgi:hypothetical protein